MEFVLLLYKHRSFGWMIRAGLADITDKSGRRSVEKFSRVLAESAGLGFTPYITQTLELTESYSDQELARRFAPSKSSSVEFLKNPDPARLQDHIRPFLDRQINAILKTAMENNIPVYHAGDSPFLYPEMQLDLPVSPAEPWFCFSKSKENTQYVLEITQDDQPLHLQDHRNLIICNLPCWLVAGKRLVHFPDGFDGKKIQPFLSKKAILIPSSAEKKYFESFISKSLKTGQVKAEGFTIHTVLPEHRLELSLEVDWQDQAVLLIYFHYGEKRILAGKKQRVFTELNMNGGEISFSRIERNHDWEEEIIGHCIKLGLEKTNESTLRLQDQSDTGNLSVYTLTEWLNRNAEALLFHGIMVNTNRAPAKIFSGTLTADIRVEPGEDWFDVTATVAFGDITVPFVELRNHILDGIREFPLPGGEVAVLPSEWFTRYRDLMWFSNAEGEKLHLPVHHFQVIRELGTEATPLLSERLKTLDPGQKSYISIPSSLKATLRPYQAEGLRWLRFLHEHQFGGCLADDMGLGKTIQALALLLSCKEASGPVSLIVMPASLIHNWQHEISRFAPSLSVMQHTGNQRTTSTGFFDTVDVVLTTYGILRSDFELLASYGFHYVVLDESQVIKNPEAQTSQAAYQLRSEHRLVLTGTPIENSLIDLWSQMEFLNPGLLGPLPGFRKRFLEKKINLDGDYNGDSALRLKRIVAPFILRRTKQEVEPDLPPLTIENWYCSMNELQSSRYESEKSAVRNEVFQQIETGGSSLASVTMLKALIRLRQLANHPGLIDPEYPGGSGKFDEIIRIAEILREEGHKTLIFSSFVKHLQLVASWFKAEGISYSMLTGSSVHREQIIRQFQDDPKNYFFLISLKAGGTGLNLTQASYVMLLDPWWNPAAELQAINRAHRIGQDKKVIAYKFITEDTIEEKMLKLQQRKQQLSDAFIPSGNPLKDLSRDEITRLFE